MVCIFFIDPNGGERRVDAPVGLSVMDAAKATGVSGVVAECGGSLSCATCHVYVDPARLHAMPPMSADEDAMLDAVASERRETSRLSCQLLVSENLDQIRFQLPETQT